MQYGLSRSGQLDRTVIVAMIAVRVMQPAVDQIVHVIAVRYRFMPAARSVHVPLLMARGGIPGRTAVRVDRADFYAVLFDAPLVWMMQVPIVQVVHVVTVDHGGVAAARSVFVIVALVHVTSHC